jgi:hypothetical protein
MASYAATALSSVFSDLIGPILRSTGLGGSLTPVTGGVDPFQHEMLQWANQEGHTGLANRYAQLGIPNSTGLSYDVAGLNLGTAAEASTLEQQNINNQVNVDKLQLAANQQSVDLANNLSSAQQELAGLQGTVGGQAAGGGNPFVTGS